MDKQQVIFGSYIWIIKKPGITRSLLKENTRRSLWILVGVGVVVAPTPNSEL
jgi:hypothetical protein